MLENKELTGKTNAGMLQFVSQHLYLSSIFILIEVPGHPQIKPGKEMFKIKMSSPKAGTGESFMVQSWWTSGHDATMKVQNWQKFMIRTRAGAHGVQQLWTTFYERVR